MKSKRITTADLSAGSLALSYFSWSTACISVTDCSTRRALLRVADLVLEPQLNPVCKHLSLETINTIRVQDCKMPSTLPKATLASVPTVED